MNKAKIMLSAIAVLAVVGGAFALKANRSQVFYFTKANASAPCRFITKVDIDLEAPIVHNAYTTLATTTTLLPSSFCSLPVQIVAEP